MGRFTNGLKSVGAGFRKVGGWVGTLSTGTKRTIKGAMYGAALGAAIANTSGDYSKKFHSTQNNLRTGAESVLTEQATMRAKANATNLDRIKMGLGFKSVLTPQQLAQIRAEAKAHGSNYKTIKNMPKTPSFDLTPTGAKNAGKGAGKGAAAGATAALALTAIKARNKKREESSPRRI